MRDRPNPRIALGIEAVVVGARRVRGVQECRSDPQLLVVRNGEAIIAHVGDSRAYIASGDIEISSEGACIKSAGGLLVEGGSFLLRSSADGIHGADSVVITGGALTIHASDDGIHADKAVSISGGSLKIPSCYEGVEALTIDISGGEIEIYPADDGMNAYGGSSFGFGPPGMFGQNADTGEGETDAESWIHISGGSITIVNKTARDADGLDSNGDILISGGSIRISLPGSGSNNAIDYGRESGGICEISGGDVVACGARQYRCLRCRYDGREFQRQLRAMFDLLHSRLYGIG